ncbi:unnamed protein product [Mytilus coruscus]|uniref:C2H2-type domain-containing protein n=1 Tax=Mytilus coruscus TaxID=42192 RepID=A0A6J8CP83_MYTCO|nr:unnamed protein product [Mytilus coruscus]
MPHSEIGRPRFLQKREKPNLKNGEVMVVMDWAMKFPPLLFREKQSDWFGQKGLNWHVTVCIFNDSENQLKHRTYVHVMDCVKQDWYSVACVNIQRYDFSESQDGKSYCDAKIAHIRGKLRKYVSNGGNISRSKDMKKALDDGDGVPGCHIAHVEIPQPADQFTLQRKIKGITKISNVQFEDYGQIKYWRNYNVGVGHILSITPVNLESTINIFSDFKVPCKDTRNILAAREKQTSEEIQSDVNLTCPEPNCNTVLHSYSELNDHCFIGIHHYLSTFDGVFDEGENSGNNANPVNVSRNMRVCHDGDGMKMFTPKDYLQPSQIISYFSRLAVLSRDPATNVVEDDIDSTIAIINQAEALEELVNLNIFV